MSSHRLNEPDIYSPGYSLERSKSAIKIRNYLRKYPTHQVIPSQPTAKKLLKTNKKTAAKIPVLVLVCEIAPASTNIEACQLSAYHPGESQPVREDIYSLPSSTEQHQLPPPELLDGENGDERGEKVFGTVTRSEESRKEWR